MARCGISNITQLTFHSWNLAQFYHRARSGAQRQEGIVQISAVSLGELPDSNIFVEAKSLASGWFFVQRFVSEDSDLAKVKKSWHSDSKWEQGHTKLEFSSRKDWTLFYASHPVWLSESVFCQTFSQFTHRARRPERSWGYWPSISTQRETEERDPALCCFFTLMTGQKVADHVFDCVHVSLC